MGAGGSCLQGGDVEGDASAGSFLAGFNDRSEQVVVVVVGDEPVIDQAVHNGFQGGHEVVGVVSLVVGFVDFGSDHHALEVLGCFGLAGDVVAEFAPGLGDLGFGGPVHGDVGVEPLGFEFFVEGCW